jgi:hypothetical protein
MAHEVRAVVARKKGAPVSVETIGLGGVLRSVVVL